MLTEVRKAVAIAPTTDFGSNRELPVLADGGARRDRARDAAGRSWSAAAT